MKHNGAWPWEVFSISIGDVVLHAAAADLEDVELGWFMDTGQPTWEWPLR